MCARGFVPRAEGVLSEEDMAYSRKKFREKLRTAIGSVDSFYAEPLLNYRGKCSDTGERYEDVATAFVLENLSALENIKTVDRRLSYKTEGHERLVPDNGKLAEIDSGKVRRKEEWLAKSMYGKSYENLGKIIDFQVPIKSEAKGNKTGLGRKIGADKKKPGKIDLIAYSEKDSVLYLLEFKRPDSKENLLRCILEAYTYYRQVNYSKLLRDFELPSDSKIIPAVLIYKQSEAASRVNSLLLQKLRKALGISIFLIDETKLIIHRGITMAYTQKFIKTDDIHTIAYREYGNRGGVPVLMLHGGPGGSVNYNNIELIDLNFFHLFTIDQRGCGNSSPVGELRANTTALLIEDIEKIRQIEQLDKCILFGRSWGTTLALLYAMKYPQNCLYLVLRGIFLGRDCDEEWTFSGSKIKFSEQWQEFSQGFDVNKSLNRQFYDKIFNASQESALQLSSRLTHYFDILATNDADISIRPETERQLLSNKIFLHYSVNHYFFEDELWEKGLPLLDEFGISGAILHGGADNDCLVGQAVYLHKYWQRSKLFIEPYASHCDNLPEIRKQIRNIFIALQKKFT